MALRAVVIPFDSGHDTTVDKRLAGLAKFRSVVNGRLDADGRIISRPRYQQLATTTYGSGTFAAYDLFELDGRLCALGDRLSRGFPTDIFEYVGAGAAWRPTDPVGSTVPRLPRATGLRELPRPPDQESGIGCFDVAANGGYVLLCYQQSGANLNAYSQVIAAAAGQTVFIRAWTANNEPSRLMRAVALTGRLWTIGANPDLDTVAAHRFDPATSTSWTGVSSLQTTSDNYIAIDACRVTGAEQFVVAALDDGGRLRIRRYDNGGTLIVPSGGQYADVTSVSTATKVAVEADSSGNSINVALTHAGTLKVYSYNLSTGATLGVPPATPTEVSGQTVTHASITRSSSTTVHVTATVTTIGTPDVVRVMRWIYTTATQAFGSGVIVIDSKLATHAVQPDTGVATAVFGIVRDGADTTPNMLVEHGAGDDQVAPLATKDLGFAAAVVAQLPHFAADLSVTPTKYYWAHALEGSDGSSVVSVCELRLNDPGRRQMARVGRGAVIAGGCPVWYDGAQLVELGFTQRPRVVSLTGSNSSGTLFSGATYNYSVMQSWFDALGRIHRSPVSLPDDIELGSAEDTVSVVMGTAITLRHNAGSATYGSTVRDEVYRTRAIQTKTAATLIGTKSVSPPESSLNGLTLFVCISDTTGYNLYTVTFDAGSTDAAAIVVDINAIVDRVTATNEDGHIRLTADEEGEGAFLEVSGGTSIDILGFTEYENDRGSTENEQGEVLHLTDTDYLPIGLGQTAGSQDTLIDTRADGTGDNEIASQAVLYTQLESPLSDHSPPPADYVWSGSGRLFMAGLPNRAAARASKLIDDIRAPAFAAEGTPGFGFELADSVEAVVVQDVSQLYFTRRAIWQVDGDGPAENGQGSFNRPRRVFTECGLVADGWRSILETAQGVWCQLGEDKLYLMQPGGSAVWAGFAIRELLQSFPVIAAATLTHNDQVAAFALQNEAGDDGRIALYDLRRQVWYIDDVDACPQALADYQGRLCYVDENQVVWRQDEDAGTGTFIPLTVTTGHATEFDVAGQGALPNVLLVGELLGECTLQLEVDYDNGAGFISAGTFALTTAGGYTVGQTVRVEFQLAEEDASSFALRISTTGNSNSAGLALVALVAFAEKDSGPALLGDRFRR